MKNIYHIAIFMLLVGYIANAQKKTLTPTDYGLWNSFSGGRSSNDGVWSCYKVHHNVGDTLYLKNARSGFRYSFPSGADGRITPDGLWFAFRQDGNLHVLKISNGDRRLLGKINNYEFTPDSKYLLAHGPDKTLQVRSLKTSATVAIDHVTEFLCINGRLLMIVETGKGSEVQALALASGKKARVADSSFKFSGLRGNKSGNALAFYETAGDTVWYLHFQNLKIGHMVFNPVLFDSIPKNGYIEKTKLHISDDGERVFFDVVKRRDSIHRLSDVVVWKTSDSELASKRYEDSDKPWQPRWYTWWPAVAKVVQVESDSFPHATLTGDAKYALLRTPANYKPVYHFGARYHDIYLKDLATGRTRLIVDKVLDRNGHALVSPGGKSVGYYKDDNWWSYDIASRTHTCLTKEITVPLYDVDNDLPGPNLAYGCAGWTNDDRQMILYDQFDIWLIATDGGKAQRLTNGRNKGIRYRVAKEVGSGSLRDWDFGFRGRRYEKKEGFLLSSVEEITGRQGFVVWKPGKGTIDWFMKDRKILSAARTKDNRTVQYVESAFNISPRWVQAAAPGRESEIVQSNQQQKQFAWGRSKLVYYKSGGKLLKGALFYPADFNPEKKYPMVVQIYEKMSGRLHDYEPPAMKNSIGFNRTNLTLEGYFVLLPDIAYTVNETGRSALNCVTAAVEEVLKLGHVDVDRIGLYGHSFGGFETAYISGQTKLFRAVIAGAGVHNLLAHHLSMDVSDISAMERHWYGQYRNVTPFEHSDFDTEASLKNVKTMDTPIMLWTGDVDKNVPSWHSKQLHAALWRLGKKSTLLVYPGEGHILTKENNQIDLTLRVQQWFGHYLKGELPEAWMQ